VTRLATYATLERLGPVIATGEAAAALRMSVSSASRLLSGLAQEGHAVRLRSGLWSVGLEAPDPFMLAPELTRPHPSYVSFESALAYHGMIDQLPREVSIASLDRARRVETSVGMFAIHHLPPAVLPGRRRRSSTSPTWAPPTEGGRVTFPSSSSRQASRSALSTSGRAASKARESAR
jgi:predicted transcriptional regulator of viral defense system